METLLIQTDETKAKGIKQLLKAFGVVYKVEKTKQKEKPYNPEFVKMVLEAKKGKTKRIDPKKLWESIL